MHEAGIGIIHDEHEDSSHQKKTGFYQKFRKFIFPGFILLLIIVSAISNYFKLLPDDYIGMVAMIIGGGFISWNTMIVAVRKKRLTAGVMVFLALIGTAYVGEYLAGAIVAFMMIIGEFLEDFTLDKTRNAVRELIKLVPDKARLKERDHYKEVPLNLVKIGDTVIVKPGERIPVDGVILRGQAAINESSLTGESMPVDKTTDDKVYVGTINENGSLEIKTLKLGRDTVMGKIIRVVQQAQENKGPTQRIADRFAVYFTPAILLICVFVWFYFEGIPFDDRLLRVMTVLVIACPCALVLAMPTAVVATVGSAAKKGALIKGGETLENAAKVTAICLDKTGTITEGKPKVVDIKTFNGYKENEVILNAAIAEKNSEHPIARAIIAKAKEIGIYTIPSPSDFNMIFGKGVKVKYENHEIQVSNAKSLLDSGIMKHGDVEEYLREQEQQGRTALLVFRDNEIIGGIAISDTIRKDAFKFIEMLKENKIKRIIMLTGDNEATAKAIASQVGIPEVMANLLPEDKLNVIKKLQDEKEIVAMVGDGINDAPALTLANVGISMGAMGTDVAIESSDISLMSDELVMIPQLFKSSRNTMKIIKQNIWVFAVAVNVIGVWLSSTGVLTPIVAAVIHNVSSLFVVGNSARLLKYRYEI